MGDRLLLEKCDPPVTSIINGSRMLYWPSPVAKPTACLFFVPGNPGLADYYIGYLTELQHLVHSDGRSSLEIFCPSHRGHDPLVPSEPARPVTLDEQIEIKAELLETICARWKEEQAQDKNSKLTPNRTPAYKPPKLILGGHSIGAYVALELVRRKLSPVRVSSLHLLFPTLHQIGQSPNARKLSWLLHSNDAPQVKPWTPALLMLTTFFLSAALRMVRMLPLPIVQFLILIASPSQPAEAVRVTTQFILRASCVFQAISMARDEIRLVKQVEALSEHQANGRDLSKTRLRAYFASGNIDGWVPEETRYVIEEVLGLQGYELPADIIEHHNAMREERNIRKKQRTFTIDEIRQVRRNSKRRALAGMVRAGASASYGLASSIGSIPYSVARRGVGGRLPPAAPSTGMSRRSSTLPSSPRAHKRRSSLLAARASRRFDGSIVIEPAEAQDTDGEEPDWLMRDQSEMVGGIVFSPAAIEPSADEALTKDAIEDASKISMQGKVFGTGGGIASEPLQMPDRASIVCRLRMPHAFVLENGDKMAAISSAMIIADALDDK